MFSALFVSTIVWHFALLDLHHTKILIPNHISKVCRWVFINISVQKYHKGVSFFATGRRFMEESEDFLWNLRALFPYRSTTRRQAQGPQILGSHDNKKGHCVQCPIRLWFSITLFYNLPKTAFVWTYTTDIFSSHLFYVATDRSITYSDDIH